MPCGGNPGQPMAVMVRHLPESAITVDPFGH